MTPSDDIQLTAGDHISLAEALEMLLDIYHPDGKLVRATIEVGDVTVRSVWFGHEVEPVVTVMVKR